MKTSELQGAALDWAVAQCEGIETKNYSGALTIRYDGDWWQPSIDWSQGGPIIEREGINIERVNHNGRWEAWTPAPERRSGEAVEQGPTPLIAAMRCYVASQLGDEVDVPNELMEAV